MTAAGHRLKTAVGVTLSLSPKRRTFSAGQVSLRSLEICEIPRPPSGGVLLLQIVAIKVDELTRFTGGSD
jgi:hypothetical protein